MPRPASARAPLANTPVPDPPVPVADGEKAPRDPLPANALEALEPCTLPVDCELPPGLLRAVPREPLAASAKVWRVALDMPRPASARALPVNTPVPDRPVPAVDGVNDPLVPVPATEAELFNPCALPVVCELPPGLLRAVPREPLAALANDCAEALDMPRPASARALPVSTPVPVRPVPAVEGANDPLVPVPATEAELLDPCALPVDCELPPGLLRAVPRAPLAALANDCADALDMPRPASARALPVSTPVPVRPVPAVEGANDPLVPDPATEADALDPCAVPVD